MAQLAIFIWDLRHLKIPFCKRSQAQTAFYRWLNSPLSPVYCAIYCKGICGSLEEKKINRQWANEKTQYKPVYDPHKTLHSSTPQSRMAVGHCCLLVDFPEKICCIFSCFYQHLSSVARWMARQNS